MKNNNTMSKELHSNLMLVTTTIAMLCFVAIMLIFMGMRNAAIPEFTTVCSRVSAVAAWVAAAVMAYKAVKKGKKYFLPRRRFPLTVGSPKTKPQEKKKAEVSFW